MKPPHRRVMGTPLEVLFQENEMVRNLGARYARWLRCWYVPAGEPLEPFQSWLTDKARERGPIDLSELLEHGLSNRDLREIRERLAQGSLAAAADDIRLLLGEVERLRNLVDALRGDDAT